MPHQLRIVVPLTVASTLFCFGCQDRTSSNQANTPAYWLAQAKSDSSSTRANAAWELGRFRPPEIAAIKVLLHDTDFNVRLTAMNSLASAGPAGISPLLELLKDERLRRRADNCSPASERIVVLQLLGATKAKEAIPAFRESLKDKDRDVRMTAAWSLGLVGPCNSD